MKKHKKAEIAMQLFKYALAGVISIIIVAFGYKTINSLTGKGCLAEIAKFEIDVKDIGTALDFRAKEQQSYQVPCDIDEIYFLELERANPDYLYYAPLVKDSLKTGASNNVFLLKEGEVKSAFSLGPIEVEYPHYKCLVPQFGKVSFFLEGTQKSALMTGTSEQPECTLIPVRITLEETDHILGESFELISGLCSTCATGSAQIEQTEDNAEISREFEIKDKNKKTKVEIKVDVEDGKRFEDFIYIESIPRECIGDLEDFLNEDIDIERGGATISTENDKLILWLFTNIKNEKKFSYKMNKVLSDECKEQFKGLGIAQTVEDTSEGEGNGD